MSKQPIFYIGIDPGKSGGLAYVYHVGPVVHAAAWPMPDTEAALALLLRTIAKNSQPFALVERVHSSPQMGVVSAFSFGRNYGTIRGVLAALKMPFDDVTPQRWQATLGCMSHGDKNITKSRAAALFPRVTVTHAIADALLIAEYCRRTRGQ